MQKPSGELRKAHVADTWRQRQLWQMLRLEKVGKGRMVKGLVNFVCELGFTTWKKCSVASARRGDH